MTNDDVSYEGEELRTLRMSDVLAAMDRLRERFAAQGERVWVLDRTEFWEVRREEAFEADKPEVSSADMVNALFFLRQAEVVDDAIYPELLADVLRFISYREEYCGD